MDNQAITAVLVSQYRATLQMLQKTIQSVPEDMWDRNEDPNKTWRLLYHVLWGLRFYLEASPEAFVPWKKAIEGAESLGAWWDDPTNVEIKGHNTPAELLEFLASIEASLEEKIAALPLNGASGFEWYPCSRLELHINNIRHVQHHTAQVIERLRGRGLSGFDWVIAGSAGAQAV